ncbi:hypothetical protein HMI56_006930 [Coelomomyces lativittatus]|nr:hypothetical protein HMI56_006930 [Coelomomyces lativittatus]
MNNEHKNEESSKKLKPTPIDFSNLPDDEEEKLKIVMGIQGFSTTKNKKHSNISAVNIHKPREYRQYMNRKGGFNRPLSPKK